MKKYYVYIICSDKNGTLYIGVTSNLEKRMFEHQNKIIQGFTAKYSVFRLVYYEIYSSIIDAITREKNLKKWNRQWKLRLIEKANPMWIDLNRQNLVNA